MIKVLPQNISNLIAAGEVVSRPASAVKELVENAIDAGAGSVSVTITDAGKTLIQVMDNGCGMSAAEAELCFERHATSKIASAEDLERITTYGFRGEALASIAAVAQVTLKTRRADDEIGTQVEVNESGIKSRTSVSTPVGSRFEIRSLFYNVPARRKFLKSDNVEMRNIIQEFLRIAIIRPQVAMKLYSNGKEIYNLHSTPNLKQRIHDIYGMNLARELVPVKVDTTVVRLSGFIGNPEDAQKRQNCQYLFVNGRYFRSPFFHKAVCMPYEKLIAEGSTPAYFIFMEVDPEKIDVNIHPAKTEIKFEDEPMIFEILMAAVRESLGKNDFTPSIDFDMKGAPEIPVVGKAHNQEFHYSAPQIDYDPLFNPFDEKSFESEKPVYVNESTSYGRIFEEETVAHDNRILILQNKFIVTPVKSGMMVIDIKRARERIFYEEYLKRMVERQPVSQQTLFPQTLKLSGEDFLTLMEQPDLVANLGFDIRDFGDSTIVIYALPDGYSTDPESVKKEIDSLIATLKDDMPMDDSCQKMAAKLAQNAASCGMERLNGETAQLLVDKLFACMEPNMTPDGRRCTTIVTLEDLEKKL